ncbi:hypothetical protein LguiA_015049 [Lonicera macranthoides]
MAQNFYILAVLLITLTFILTASSSSKISPQNPKPFTLKPTIIHWKAKQCPLRDRRAPKTEYQMYQDASEIGRYRAEYFYRVSQRDKSIESQRAKTEIIGPMVMNVSSEEIISRHGESSHLVESPPILDIQEDIIWSFGSDSAVEMERCITCKAMSFFYHVPYARMMDGKSNNQLDLDFDKEGCPRPRAQTFFLEKDSCDIIVKGICNHWWRETKGRQWPITLDAASSQVYKNKKDLIENYCFCEWCYEGYFNYNDWVENRLESCKEHCF